MKTFRDTRALLESAAERAISYLEEAPRARGGAWRRQALARLAELDLPLQEDRLGPAGGPAGYSTRWCPRPPWPWPDHAFSAS